MVNGVRFTRSAFVQDGAWCLAGTRLPVLTIQRALEQEGVAYVARNWPGYGFDEREITAFGLFRAPAPDGPAMRAEEV